MNDAKKFAYCVRCGEKTEPSRGDLLLPLCPSCLDTMFQPRSPDDPEFLKRELKTLWEFIPRSPLFAAWFLLDIERFTELARDDPAASSACEILEDAYDRVHSQLSAALRPYADYSLGLHFFEREYFTEAKTAIWSAITHMTAMVNFHMHDPVCYHDLFARCYTTIAEIAEQERDRRAFIAYKEKAAVHARLNYLSAEWILAKAEERLSGTREDYFKTMRETADLYLRLSDAQDYDPPLSLRTRHVALALRGNADLS